MFAYTENAIRTFSMFYDKTNDNEKLVLIQEYLNGDKPAGFVALKKYKSSKSNFIALKSEMHNEIFVFRYSLCDKSVIEFLPRSYNNGRKINCYCCSCALFDRSLKKCAVQKEIPTDCKRHLFTNRRRFLRRRNKRRVIY